LRGGNGWTIVNEHPPHSVPQPLVVVEAQTVFVPGRNIGEVGIRKVVTHGTLAAEVARYGPSVVGAIASLAGSKFGSTGVGTGGRLNPAGPRIGSTGRVGSGGRLNDGKERVL
jgi:hypothetical protein